jgi:hypothetical protein
MNYKTFAGLLFVLLPLNSFAATILNGDFQTGDYTGWSQDVDGFGEPSWGNDFSIVEPTLGNFVARIESDYVDGNGGDLDESWHAATLYQELDFSVSAGQMLVLNFDWVFGGEDPINADESFFVALGDGSGDYYGADGNLGFLVEEYTYGSNTFNMTLDASFLNATGWSIEFQVGRGYDYFGSYALIDNVAIEAVTPSSIPVPEPSILWLMSFGLLGLVTVAKKKSI